jgi:hypothetical protein
MRKKQLSTEKALALLLSGKHPKIKKYAGKHVFVVGDEIVLMKKGEEAWKDFETLTKKYGQPPTLIFVPRPDITYILVC